jgi:NAD(P)-dependent dehydrogenase (short-subunit alcohol dehydrogenase family)
MERLAGVVALVTGGNTGIGEAVSRRLAGEGSCVAVGWFEDEEGAIALAERLSSQGRKCIPVWCDVTDGESVSGALDRTERELGAIGVLVNNAGVLSRIPFLEMKEEEWDRTMQVSLYGSSRCCRLALPRMVRNGRGAIVNFASELAYIGSVDLAHYVAAKAGVIGLTRALAREFGPRGVRVNAVAPGPTETRMIAGITPEFVRSIALGRLGRPDDIAAAVAFLCSEDAAWITGQVLGVNGGLVMQ